MDYEFDDFKPAQVEEGNPDVKRIIEHELTELETFKNDNDEIIYGSEESKMTLTEMMVEYIQNVGDVNEVNYCSYNSRYRRSY